MNNQLNPGQMSQMLGRINVGPGAGPLNHQNMGNQMCPMGPNGMPQMAPNNMGVGPNVMNPQIPINQQNMTPSQMSGGGPMGMNPMMNMQQQHMARKPQEMMMNNSQNMYQGKNCVQLKCINDMNKNFIYNSQFEMLVLVNSFEKVQAQARRHHQQTLLPLIKIKWFQVRR